MRELSPFVTTQQNRTLGRAGQISGVWRETEIRKRVAAVGWRDNARLERPGLLADRGSLEESCPEHA